MEPKSGQTEDENTWEQSVEQKAADQTPATSTSASPRRGLRARKVGRPKSGGLPAPDTNGAAPSPRSSGRVLRDRSTRSVPAWLKDTKSDDEDEPSPLPTATKRRKVSYSRRKKPTESAGSTEPPGEDGGDPTSTKDLDDLEIPAVNVHVSPARCPAAQSRGKASSARAAKGSARPVCKSEPGADSPAVTERQVRGKEKCTTAIQKQEEAEEDVVNEEDLPGEKGLLFEDHPGDEPQAHSEEVEEEAGGLSSDEDPPFRDDLNDQSYNPKPEREAPRPKRRAPPRPKDKKDTSANAAKAGEAADVKVEGSEYMEPLEEDVKTEEESREDPEGPRKRGRRRKDDKTPRLPKRRKKPPVQYVRCEIEGCGTVLAHPRYLQHHIKYQHLLKKKYVCPHPSCGRLFRLQKQLLRHAKHHTDQRDYICEFCARAFKSSHNLAVHRMIHTGEKPLQCEICGFTCRQKASLNWHMKKHDADATYQFSCSICSKKFEKKDCVVAHKAKSHPEVLIAEALAANAGALITTPPSLLELQGGQVRAAQPEVAALEVAPAAGQQQAGQHVGHRVVLLGQDHQSLHTMQVPVTIALSPADPPSPDGRQQQQQQQQQQHLQLQMPLHFVQTTGPQAQQQHTQIQQLTLTHSGSVVSQPQIQQLTLHSGAVVTQHQGQLLQQQQQQQQPQQQQQQQQQQQLGQTEVLHMTFQPVGQAQSHLQQIPLQLQTLQTAPAAPGGDPQQHQGIVANGDSYVLDTSVLTASASPALHQQGQAVVWEQTAEGLADGGVRALL